MMSDIPNSIKEALLSAKVGDTIPCAAALSIASRLSKSPAEIGAAMNMLSIKISKCQLGLFGYGEKKKIIKVIGHVSPQIAKILQEAVQDNRIACKMLFEIAQTHNMPLFEIACACETMGIKIVQCQLGAF